MSETQLSKGMLPLGKTEIKVIGDFCAIESVK